MYSLGIRFIFGTFLIEFSSKSFCKEIIETKNLMNGKNCSNLFTFPFVVVVLLCPNTCTSINFDVKHRSVVNVSARDYDSDLAKMK